MKVAQNMIFVLLLLCSSAFAQLGANLVLPGAASSVLGADMQYVTTLHDTIPLYGTQADSPLHDFANAGPNDCVVVDGPVTFGGTATVLDVLVREGGSLTLADGFNLKCRNLIVWKGRCDMQGHGTLTIRDIPIDLTVDPKQWGATVLCIDGIVTAGTTDWRQAWATLNVEPRAGNITIQTTTVGKGWRAGDQLVLPDTRQPATTNHDWSQTEVVTIKSIYKNSYNLTKPLTYDHVGWHRQDGAVGLLPDVGCLTQPIVVKSENPNGTRAHTAVTQYGHWLMKGVQFLECGRTTTAPLGTANQIARYATHFHHAIGSLDWTGYFHSEMNDCVFWGSPKWGCSIHDSYNANVSNCLAYDCAGAGIVTEDVYSYDFRIANNMVVAGRPGSGLRITTDHGGRGIRNDPTGDFWTNRCGYGLGSMMGQITNNRAYCCSESYGMAGFSTTWLYRPVMPGVCASCDVLNREMLNMSKGYDRTPKRYPFLFDTSNNMAWAGWRGIETWTADCYPDRPERLFPGFTTVHCRQPTNLEDQEETYLFGWKLLGDFSQCKRPTGADEGNTFALNFKDKYRFGITCDRCEFRGYDAAYRLFDDSYYTLFNGCIFECPTVVYQPDGRVGIYPWRGEWNSCDFQKVNGAVRFMDGNYPGRDLKLWLALGNPTRTSLIPITYKVRPWYDGRNLDVYHYEQLPSFSLPPIAANQAYGDWPAGVNTHQQLIDMGTPIFGAAVPATAFQSDEFGPFYANEVK